MSDAAAAAAAAADYVAVYADESCIGNGRDGDNPGGAAGVVEWQSPHSQVVRRFDYWICEPASTNNRMALRSVIEAFRGLSRKGRRLNVRFTTDSRYIVDGMTLWVPGWIARAWRRKVGALQNRELWKEAVELAGAHVVQWEWVRGHAGQPQNEYAHHLAMRAAIDQTSSDGFVASEFDRWFATYREKLTTSIDAAPLPNEQNFNPSPRTWTN